MLLYLFDYLTNFESDFLVFQYLTLRCILGALTALIISFMVGPLMIRYLSYSNINQNIRDDGPENHHAKMGTPTMGGGLILVAISISTLLWSDLENRYVWVALLVTLGYGGIGFVDDYRKLKFSNSDGMSAKNKFLWQSVVALIAAIYLFNTAELAVETQLIVPFFKSIVFDMGWMYVLLTFLVIVGSSNAVNITDGLDGLAVMPVVMVAAGLAIFAYLSGHLNFSQYLFIPYLPNAGELIVFCAALVGAGLGFLWFNAYPAMVFMGDMGSLALGAAIGVLAVLVRQELVLAIMGGIFVMEIVSVIIQVTSFKLTGKRAFRMAPIHHHFELKGWPESRIIIRFWIITVILVLIGLSALKLR